jgi:DNA-binding GntR family transcriptional regulator
LNAIYRKKTPDKAGEHKAILDAALSHDVEKALDLIDKHIRATTADVLENARKLFAN